MYMVVLISHLFFDNQQVVLAVSVVATSVTLHFLKHILDVIDYSPYQSQLDNLYVKHPTLCPPKLSTINPDLNLFNPFASCISNDSASLSNKEVQLQIQHLSIRFFQSTNISHGKSLCFSLLTLTSVGLNVNGGISQLLQVSFRCLNLLVSLEILQMHPQVF